MTPESLQEKQRAVLRALRARQMTRHEIAEATGIALESVCGRVNALMEMGRIEVARYQRHPGTGKHREVLRIRKAKRAAA